MNAPRLVAGCVVLALLAMPRAARAQPASNGDVLDLVEAALAAGEGLAAQVLLQKYQQTSPRSARVVELEALASFYAGDYATADKLVTGLREDPNAVLGLGELADLIQATHRTTKHYATAEHGNFVVRYVPGPDEVLLPYAFDTLQAIERAMQSELGVQMVGPVRLEIYPDAESLAQVSTLSVEAIRKTGTIALCKWGRLMIASPRALFHGYPWLDTIAHEYVHLVLTKASLDRAPVWFQEGVAKFLESRWRRDKPALRLDPASERLLYRAATTGKLLDFDRLHPSIALLPSQEDAALAFAQVSSFVERFYAQYGAAGLRAALDAMALGKDARQAFVGVAKQPWGRLERAWRESVAARPEPPSAKLLPRYLSDETNENDELFTVELADARKHARLGDLLWSRAHPGAASVEYAKAHVAAPADPVVASRYARSAIAGGRPGEAIAPLQQTLRLYPMHAPAHSSLATALYRTGDIAGATEASRQAIALNPFDPQPHCILAQTPAQNTGHEADACSRLGGIRE